MYNTEKNNRIYLLFFLILFNKHLWIIHQKVADLFESWINQLTISAEKNTILHKEEMCPV